MPQAGRNESDVVLLKYMTHTFDYYLQLAIEHDVEILGTLVEVIRPAARIEVQDIDVNVGVGGPILWSEQPELCSSVKPHRLRGSVRKVEHDG